MKYATIAADPPWRYERFAGYQGTPGKSNWREVVKQLPYESLSFEQLAVIPVGDLAAPDCRLFCWATSRYLPDAIDLIRAWGFTYKQALVWHKTGRPFPLSGSIAPNHAEFLLVAVRGAPPRLAKLPSSVIAEKRPHQHSRKPEIFLDLIEQISPGPYLELFARRNRFGWDTWGDEALKHVELVAVSNPASSPVCGHVWKPLLDGNEYACVKCGVFKSRGVSAPASDPLGHAKEVADARWAELQELRDASAPASGSVVGGADKEGGAMRPASVATPPAPATTDPSNQDRDPAKERP